MSLCSDGVVLLQLVEWLKWHFPIADELVQECMRNDNDKSPCNHPKYWDAIFALVLQVHKSYEALIFV